MDTITVFWGDGLSDPKGYTAGSFRVYENSAKPIGSFNFGEIDLRGRFGSLNFTGLANPRGGGFITPNDAPLTSLVRTVIPEPSTWMLMILGFGLIAQQLRRRHLAAA